MDVTNDAAIRRIDLDAETLLMDAGRGRVVRLRGSARDALEGAVDQDARVVRGYLQAIGVLPGQSPHAETATGRTFDRRSVLNASAAAALGVTVLALPSAASAASPGAESNSVRTGFVQVREFTAPGGTAPSDDLYRSFTHGGKIHLLDSAAPWNMYVFASSLDAVEVISITGVEQSYNWASDSSDFLVVGDVAYISAIREDDQSAFHLDIVRLALPLVAVEGEVAATVWSVGLSSRLVTQDVSSRSWSFTDAGGVTRTVSGASLTPYLGGDPVDTVQWGHPNSPPPIGRMVLDSGKLYFMLSYRTMDEYTTTYQYLDPATSTDRNESIHFRLEKYELLSVDTTNPATRVFTEMNIDFSSSGSSSFRSTQVNISTNIDMYGVGEALVRSGTAIFLGEGFPSIRALRVPLADPTTWSLVANLALPAALTQASIADYVTAPGGVRVSADRLLLAAEVRLSANSNYHAAVIGIDLTEADLPVDEYVLIGAADSYSDGPMTADATYLYVGLWNEDGVFAVARVTRSPLALDGTATTGLDDFVEHYGYTAQPSASGVLMAGSGTAPVAAFAFVAPS